MICLFYYFELVELLVILINNHLLPVAMSVEDLPRKEVNVLKGHEGGVLAARFNSDGNYILSCGKDRTIRLWNPHRGIHIKTYKSHGREVRDVHVTTYTHSLTFTFFIQE